MAWVPSELRHVASSYMTVMFGGLTKNDYHLLTVSYHHAAQCFARGVIAKVAQGHRH